VNPSKKTGCGARLLSLFLMLALPAAVQAQFTFTTNADNTITITGYTGSGGAVTIPDTTNGYSVTSIGIYAFKNNSSVTSVTISTNVVGIGGWAFQGCTNLTNIVIPNSVTSIGSDAFIYCAGLTNNVTIPSSVTNIWPGAFLGLPGLMMVDVQNLFYSSVNGVLFDKNQTTLIQCPSRLGGSYWVPNGVTSIGSGAFDVCASITNVIISASVTNIGNSAFFNCTGLTSVYCLGNAPSVGNYVFQFDGTTVYYLPGTTGWGSSFGSRPTALWSLPYPLILNFEPNFGVRTNRFDFTISWATNISVVVDACTNLANPDWSPLQTNTLTSGWCYFSDPQWTNYPGRFYRLRSP
jgi:hypothetical protein